MQQYSKAQKGDDTRILRLVAPIVRLISESNQILNVFQQFRSAGYQGGLVSH